MTERNRGMTRGEWLAVSAVVLWAVATLAVNGYMLTLPRELRFHPETTGQHVAYWAGWILTPPWGLWIIGVLLLIDYLDRRSVRR